MRVLPILANCLTQAGLIHLYEKRDCLWLPAYCQLSKGKHSMPSWPLS